MGIAVALMGIAIAAVPVPVLAMRRRPGGGVLCRRRLGVPRIGTAVAQRYRHANEFFLSRENAISSPSHSEIAIPAAPARAVRPMRCT